VNPEDHLALWLAVAAREGPGEGNAGHTIIVDFFDLEEVFGNIIERDDDHDIPWTDLKTLGFIDGRGHSPALLTRCNTRSTPRKPSVRLSGTGKLMGLTKPGNPAKMISTPATGCEIERRYRVYRRSSRPKTRRSPPPARVRSQKVDSMRSSPIEGCLL
jgi:hypothetical protein